MVLHYISFYRLDLLSMSNTSLTCRKRIIFKFFRKSELQIWYLKTMDEGSLCSGSYCRGDPLAQTMRDAFIRIFYGKIIYAHWQMLQKSIKGNSFGEHSIFYSLKPIKYDSLSILIWNIGSLSLKSQGKNFFPSYYKNTHRYLYMCDTFILEYSKTEIYQ